MAHRVCSLSGRRPRCVVRVAAFCTVGFFVVNHFAVKLTLAGALGRCTMTHELYRPRVDDVLVQFPANQAR